MKFSLRDFARNYGYSIYVLFALLLAYLLNQLDRYMLAITAQPMAQEIHFGDHGCLPNKTTDFPHLDAARCNGTTEAMCTDIIVNGTNDVCKWDYNGQGYEYQVVAGPVFTLVYTFAGIFIGFAADRYNRKLLLAICLMFWSVMTIVTGFIKEYWQLVVLRFGLGFGEAGCTPFATSLIADYYTESVRGLALGVYNWGIYMGYSFSYLLGNRIMEANIFDQGWRSTFYLSGIPGVILGIIIIFSVKEPVRPSKAVPPSNIQNGEVGMCGKLVTILRPFLSPSLIMLCVAGSIRNAAGYVWAYNTQPYFRAIQQTPDQISSWMGWIPLVGGSIGVVTGGFISDRFVKNRGLYARVFVLVASQILAAPFAAGTLYFNPPYGYVCQIPTYIIGEMWVGVTLTVVVELVPSTIRASAVAVYLFIITNIGGAFPLLVPPLQQHFEAVGASKAEALRDALYILYPGLYVGGAALFLLTMFMLKRDQRRAQQADYQPILGDNKEK